MTRGIAPVPEGLAPNLSDFLEQLRRVSIDVQAGRVAALLGGGTGAGTQGPPGNPGPPGPPGTPYVPDLTPPPTVSGVVVTAGLDFVFIETDAPTFSQGNGYARTLVYGATYGGTGPLPTFSSAVLVHEFVGQVGSFATPPGTQWHIWVKWRTDDGVLSVSPAGGANGYQVTTALIGNSNLGPLIIEAGNLAAGAVTTAKFAAGIEPVSIVSSLPTALGYTGPKTVFLTTDGKLYRYVAGAWVTSVAAVDITGQITTTQITDGSISTPKLAANSVTAAKIAADTITANEIAAGAITANELATNSVIAGKISAGAVSVNEISAGSIQAIHLAANSIAVGTVAIQNGAIVNAMIGDATITDAKIVSLSATKITAGTIAVGEYIKSSDFVDGASGWYIGGNTSQFPSTSIRGLLTASQIDTRGLTIKNAAGDIVFNSTGGAVPVDGYRGSNPEPQQCVAGESFYFKSKVSGFDGPAAATDYGVLRIQRPYGAGADLSGGAVIQWFESSGLVWSRSSTSATTWGAWEAVPNGTITAANASTFIANAAIGALQVGSISADSITTGTLNADRINVNSLNANKLVVQSVTTDRILPGAVTSKTSASAGYIGAALTAASTSYVGATQAVLTFTAASSSSTPKMQGVIYGSLLVNNAAAVTAVLQWVIKINSTTIANGTEFIKTFPVSGGTFCSFNFSALYLEAGLMLGATSLAYTFQATIGWRDVTNTPVSCGSGGSFGATAYLVVEESKV